MRQTLSHLELLRKNCNECSIYYWPLLAFSGLPDIFRGFVANRKILDVLPRFPSKSKFIVGVESNDSCTVARGEILAAGSAMF